MSDGAPHEIVIIKRVSGGHEDEHHGGVWKIAFADFMTAMMAFFLVMWLISANDKTKAVIARYFNPVQLVDSTPQPKGLEDPKAGSPSVMPKAGSFPESKAKPEKLERPPEAKPNNGPEPAPAKHGDDELFKDPYAVLAEIAGRSDAQPLREKFNAPEEGVKGGTGAVGIKGGAAFRDPFEPLPMPRGNAADLPPISTVDPAPISDASSFAAPPRPSANPAQSPPVRAVPAAPPAELALGSAPAGDKGAQADLSSRIEAAVAAVQGKSGATDIPRLEIRHTSEGTLIDLTDGVAFSMFATASAEPSPKLVRLMEKIGRAIKAEKGLITIRGFTDNQPFRSDSYDNWRLSAARADMAHYMLVRGGVDDQRFERIEGYADRKPKNPKDPGGAENRRIEILVRDAMP